MAAIDIECVERALDALPHRYRGPGGVAGVVHRGRVVASRAWGHRDTDRRLPMTASTRLPICSISKQFTCAALLAAVGEPEALDPRLPSLLPAYQDPLPAVRDLCHNQSGLRDYWALTVLAGARPGQDFPREAALPFLALSRTGHFAPGTRYSYNNGNFRLLGALIEGETGRGLVDLVAEHLFRPAGMATALFAGDTRHPPDEVVGYEGSDARGFMSADNGIFWIGDAGISAALTDMLAWEIWIDGSGADLYARLAAPVTFRDGAAAAYGFGLSREKVAGVDATGHGGALRGFRAQRMHVASERLSAYVAFNHEADAHGAAAALVKAALGRDDPEPGPVPADWGGTWLCAETGLLARLAPGPRGAALHFSLFPDILSPDGDRLTSPSVSVEREGRHLVMRRAGENLVTRMDPLSPVDTVDDRAPTGRYRNDEVGSTLTLHASGGAVSAVFEGSLGIGPAERVHPAAPDLWTLATRRSLDAPAPGDWTLQVHRGRDGTIDHLTLGSWLARGTHWYPIA
jgi:D-aminopeptidase